MRDFIDGVAAMALMAGVIFIVVIHSENKSLRERNMDLVDKITEIQSDQAKLALIEQNALRRKVRKIAAKESAK